MLSHSCQGLSSHCRAHIALTAHASTQVIDEADRLLRQAYQDWLPFVTAATEPPREPHSQGGSWGSLDRQRVIKIIASATLTRDPSKIDRLALHCPRYIALGAADHRCFYPSVNPSFNQTCASYVQVSTATCVSEIDILGFRVQVQG